MKVTKSVRQCVMDVLEGAEGSMSVCEIYRKMHRELFSHVRKEKATALIKGALDVLKAHGSINASTTEKLNPGGGMVEVPVYYAVRQGVLEMAKPSRKHIFSGGELETIIKGMAPPFTLEAVVDSVPETLDRRDVSNAVACKIHRMVVAGELRVVGKTYSRNGRTMRIYDFPEEQTPQAPPAPTEDPKGGTFYFKHFPVRTLVKDGKTLFNARDIASILGFLDPEEAVANYCERVDSGMVSATGCSRMIFVSKTGNKYDLVEWLIDVGGKVRTVDPEPSVELQQAIETITALQGRLERIEQTLWPAA